MLMIVIVTVANTIVCTAVRASWVYSGCWLC